MIGKSEPTSECVSSAAIVFSAADEFPDRAPRAAAEQSTPLLIKKFLLEVPPSCLRGVCIVFLFNILLTQQGSPNGDYASTGWTASIMGGLYRLKIFEHLILSPGKCGEVKVSFSEYVAAGFSGSFCRKYT